MLAPVTSTQRMDINLGTSLVVIIHKVCVKALLTVRIWSYDHNFTVFSNFTVDVDHLYSYYF